MKELYNRMQQKNFDYVKNDMGKGEWTYLSRFSEDGKEAVANEWVILVKKDDFGGMSDSGLGQQLICCCTPGFTSSSDGTFYEVDTSVIACEKIVNFREFHGAAQDYVEINQEFVLLFNLYYDRRENRYYAFKDNGEKEEVIVFEGPTDVRVKTKYLRRYASAKQLYIIIGFYYRNISKIDKRTAAKTKLNECVRDEMLVYRMLGFNDYNDSTKVVTIMQGQKNIKPEPVEKCGIWPYDHKADERGEKFIIGVDENGENVYSEPLSPHGNYEYLTPVFFKKEVLHRYISEPEKFKVDDGFLSRGCLWGLRMDAEDADYVNVYLGDLATELPVEEHKHWAYYNVPPRKSVSRTRFMRDFMAEFTNPESMDFKFKQDFERFQQKWKEKYGWSFYRELHEGDQYHYTTLLASVLNNQQEFDARVLNLCIILVDYLNEAELGKMITIPEGEKNVQGLKKLKLWLLQNGIAGFEVHYDFLHSLYQLRSKGSGAHRKSTSYDAALSKFRMNEGESFKAIFNRILQKADAFALFMLRVCCDEKAV